MQSTDFGLLDMAPSDESILNTLGESVGFF